ncbi:JmjC domain-containing protein [Kitasatospora purpeofusca]|uniref:Cupin domain-containing protein n=1 Tax=Kitasatospora purpeofusca TaxID=67352 RepID=A0ABZ1U0V2_9ACTN|nr:cupin domain-containing protein [Kitasatospora purpeofusca]
MSLAVLLGPAADSLLASCPIEPQVYRRSRSELDEQITLGLMDTYIDHGLSIPSFTAAVKDGRAVHPGRFSKNGEMLPGRLRALFDDGHTINLRHVQRTVPYLAEVCRSIREETGYSLHVSAILTPAAQRGLRHHWDPFTAVVTQMHGRKVWPIWAPEVELPVDDYLDSPMMWTAEMQERWDSSDPYAEFDLGPGDTLVLPRGWVHSPHNTEGEDTSFHLTFALRERTVLDLAEGLVAAALPRPEFRAGIAPNGLKRETLAETLQDVRRLLVSYLTHADTSVSAEVLHASLIGKLV